MSIEVDGIFVFNPRGVTADEAGGGAGGVGPMSDRDFWTYLSDLQSRPSPANIDLDTNFRNLYFSQLVKSLTSKMPTYPFLISDSGYYMLPSEENQVGKSDAQLTKDYITAYLSKYANARTVQVPVVNSGYTVEYPDGNWMVSVNSDGTYKVKELNYTTLVWEETNYNTLADLPAKVLSAEQKAAAQADATAYVDSFKAKAAFLAAFNAAAISLGKTITTIPRIAGNGNPGAYNQSSINDLNYYMKTRLYVNKNDPYMNQLSSFPEGLDLAYVEIIGKVLTSVAKTPEAFGLTPEKYAAWMSMARNVPSNNPPGIPTSPGLSKWLDTIEEYVERAKIDTSTAAPGMDNSNPLNALLNSYYRDTLSPQVAKYGAELNFIDPSHAKIPPPTYDYFKELMGVDLNSPTNKALYRSILQQYVTTNGLTDSQQRRILAAHNDATLNDAWAQKMELRLQAQLIANLVQDGNINLTAQVKADIMNKLPASVRASLNTFSTEDTAEFYGSATNLNVEIDQLAMIVGAVMVAGASRIDEAKSLVDKMSYLSSTVSFNGILILGAGAALEAIIHPIQEALVEFLRAMGEIVLKYRNDMLKIQFDDANVSAKLTTTKRAEIFDQMKVITSLISNSKEQRIRAEQEKQKNIIIAGVMIGLAVLMAILATIISIVTFGAGSGSYAAVGAFVTAAGATAGATGAAAAAAVTAVAVSSTAITAITISAAASVGLAVAGAFQMMSAFGINVGAMIMNSVSSEMGKDALMGSMLGLTALLAILTALSLGALSGMTSITASIAASTAVQAVSGFAIAITSAAANDRLMKVMTEAFKNSGMSDKDASMKAAIALAFINLALVSLSFSAGMGKSIAQAFKSVFSTASESTSASNFFSMLKGMVASATPSVSLGSILNGIKGILPGLKSIASDGAASAQFIAKIIQMTMNLVQQITSGQSATKQAQTAEQRAIMEQVQQVVQMCIQILDQVLKSMPKDAQVMMQAASQNSLLFQQLVQDLTKAVIAITSNTVAPIAAPTSGSGAQNEMQNDNRDPKKNPATPSIEEPTLTSDEAAAALAALASLGAQGAMVMGTQEGYETSMMGKTSTEQMTALMMLTRMLGMKLGQILTQMGITNPQIAEQQGMLLAGNLLKQMAALAKGEIPLGKDAKETLGKNSVMATIAFLLGSKGLDQEQMGSLENLFQGRVDGSDEFSDDQLNQLEGLLQKLAENETSADQPISSLLNNYKALMAQKNVDPLEFSFKLLQLFAQAFGLGNADLKGLKKVFGDDFVDDNVIAQVEDGGEDYSSLIYEYFLAPTSNQDRESAYEAI